MPPGKAAVPIKLRAGATRGIKPRKEITCRAHAFSLVPEIRLGMVANELAWAFTL